MDETRSDSGINQNKLFKMATKEEKEATTNVATVSEKNICDKVLNRINTLENAGELKIPANYSPENALKGAFLQLQDIKDKNGTPVLQSCTEVSIANALMKMVVQGLSVIKNQCYFIAYGNTLTFQRSVFGTMALAERVANVKAVGQVIYEGDEFEYSIDTETGLKKLIKHGQKLQNISNQKIIGAYCTVIENHGSCNQNSFIDVMTIEEIKQSWMQGQAKGNGSTHQNFTQEMAKKTVITRTLKPLINSSSDANLYTDEDESPTVEQEVKTTIETTAKEIVHDPFKEVPEAIVDTDKPNEPQQTESNLFDQEDPFKTK